MTPLFYVYTRKFISNGMTAVINRVAVLAFSIALAGIGILQIVFRTILVGRPPAMISNGIESVIGIATGLLLIACAGLIATEKNSKWLAAACAVFVFAWSALPNLFLVVKGDIGLALTSFGKAITLGSGILLLGYISTNPNQSSWIAALARYCLGLFLLASGVQHFIYADFVKFLVPSWIPWSNFWTYASGVALVLVGLSLILRIKENLTTLAGGIMIGVWFIILHIPRAIADPGPNEWTAVCESLAVSATLFMLSLRLSPKVSLQPKTI